MLTVEAIRTAIADFESAGRDLGLFDWLDESGRGIGETYAERLQMLERADRSGFYGYHLAKHHATELTTVPSPHIFLASVARRTQRLRLGPLSVIPPLSSPDPSARRTSACSISEPGPVGARPEPGLHRRAHRRRSSPSTRRSRRSPRRHADGLSSGKVEFHGKLFDYAPTITRLQPVRRPYPPLWYPTSNTESIPWLAANGLSTG